MAHISLPRTTLCLLGGARPTTVALLLVAVVVVAVVGVLRSPSPSPCGTRCTGPRCCCPLSLRLLVPVLRLLSVGVLLSVLCLLSVGVLLVVLVVVMCVVYVFGMMPGLVVVVVVAAVTLGVCLVLWQVLLCLLDPVLGLPQHLLCLHYSHLHLLLSYLDLLPQAGLHLPPLLLSLLYCLIVLQLQQYIQQYIT